MQAKKLVALIGLALMLFSNNTSARPFGHRGHHDDHFRVVIFPPRIRPVFICPPRRIFVGPPVIVAPAAPPIEVVQNQTVTVWITNDNGSKSAVTLTKETGSPGYIGPKGEYYSSMPTEDQLKVLYGLCPKATENASFTVWIKNDNGSMMPVTLIRKETGYVGPSGEYYPAMPTEEQLKNLYAPQPKTADANNVTIWLDNSDGTKTPVVLTKSGTEFIGPNGEYYKSMPTKEQLKAMYSQKPTKTVTESTTIWIENSDGTKIPITLQKDGSGFIGPAGERYPSLPTAEQLKLLYCSTAKGSEQAELSFEITNSDGTKTEVTLKKEGSEFVGPKGERYPNMPTEEQLKMVYGK